MERQYITQAFPTIGTFEILTPVFVEGSLQPLYDLIEEAKTKAMLQNVQGEYEVWSPETAALEPFVKALEIYQAAEVNTSTDDAGQ